MVLCFEFVTERVFTTPMFSLLLSSACPALRLSLFPTLFPFLSLSALGCRWERSCERTQPGQLTQTDQRHITCHKTSGPVRKAEGKKEGVGTSVVMVCVFPSNHYVCEGPAFQEVAKHILAHGK